MGKVKPGRVTRSKQTILRKKMQMHISYCVCKQGMCGIFNLSSKDYKKLRLRWLISKGYMIVKSNMYVVIV